MGPSQPLLLLPPPMSPIPLRAALIDQQELGEGFARALALAVSRLEKWEEDLRGPI